MGKTRLTTTTTKRTKPTMFKPTVTTKATTSTAAGAPIKENDMCEFDGLQADKGNCERKQEDKFF